jgi:hypothetical protein
MRFPPFVALLLLSACGHDTLELFPGAGIAPDGHAPTAGDDASAPAATAQNGDATTDANDAAFGDRASPAVESGSAGLCQSDLDCHGENHRCQPGLHVCVQCIGDPTDCAGQGSESRCNLVNYTCAVPCAPDGGCPAPDVCDSQGVCADCLNSSQCPADQPRCFNEDCVCLSNADCPDGGVCGSDQTCR